MSLIDNNELIFKIEQDIKEIDLVETFTDSLFIKDFSLRFCWSSNAIEGNTLSLDDTISLIEYDEVRGGHTYTEYEEAKNLYGAIKQMLIPFEVKEITESWIKKANGLIRRMEGEYRKNQVYIGSIIEAVYYPPSWEKVEGLMEAHSEKINFKEKSCETVFHEIALQHILFERIHPFMDGNGRVGRMILNQQLINHNMLPIIIKPDSKYRQAFLRYEKNKDISVMCHVLCKGELESLERVKQLIEKRESAVELKEEPEWSPKL